MIAGLGVDLVDVARIARVHGDWGERLERKILADGECAALPSKLPARRRRLAMAFAAKEALAKALGSGMREPVLWRNIEVVRDELGAPGFELGAPMRKMFEQRGIGKAFLSLTDDAGMVVAAVVLEADAG